MFAYNIFCASHSMFFVSHSMFSVTHNMSKRKTVPAHQLLGFSHGFILFFSFLFLLFSLSFPFPFSFSFSFYFFSFFFSDSFFSAFLFLFLCFPFGLLCFLVFPCTQQPILQNIGKTIIGKNNNICLGLAKVDGFFVFFTTSSDDLTFS